MTENSRIRRVYHTRSERGIFRRYSLFIAGELYMLQRREEETLRLLRGQGITDLEHLRILEIGCGRGNRLADWIRWGACASLLHGIDLVEAFVREASSSLPTAKLLVGSAAQLPYKDSSFDIVVQLTVLSSILDADVRRAVAREMARVVRPTGLMIWYDFRYPSPKNPDVHPIGLSELNELYRGWEVSPKSMTLLPPLSRKLARVSFCACRCLEMLVPPLRSHYIAALRKTEL